jgi:hypothetical protein
LLQHWIWHLSSCRCSCLLFQDPECIFWAEAEFIAAVSASNTILYIDSTHAQIGLLCTALRQRLRNQHDQSQWRYPTQPSHWCLQFKIKPW